MVYDYDEISEKIEHYLADFSENGYSSEKFEELAKALHRNDPLGAVFEVFGCDDFERAAIALGFVVSISGKAVSAVSGIFRCPSGSVTPHSLCALFCGDDNVCNYAEAFSEEFVLCRLFSGTSVFGDPAMRLRSSICKYILFGEVREKYLMPLEVDPNGRFFGTNDNVTFVKSALHAYNGDNVIIVNLYGESGSGRKTALGLAAAGLGIRFVLVDLKRLSGVGASELSALLAVLGVFPAVTLDGRSDGDMLNTEEYDLLNAIAEETGLAAVISEGVLDDTKLSADLFSLHIDLPDTEAQTRIWSEKSKGYSVDGSVDFAELASEFPFTPSAVEKALRYALISSPDTSGGKLTAADIKRGCYLSVGSDMGGRAVKINTVFGWNDLVLPEYSKRLLRAACDRVKHGYFVYEKWGFGKRLPYGRGVSMIFTGPPGTGKTMAAQIIAGELGLALYKVNLAAVVSKYVGETEKNLNEIFDCARKSHIVLFFDEADVLFGKRTEVRDSNDKYSNMEAAFLLQKIEEYSGIVILATNFVQNFDEAFKRRMKFLVEFPFPGKAQREEIWRRVFPPETPVEKLDIDFLVENFELSGSNIKNIAVYSAFLAAAANDPAIEMKHIIPALKNEFAKSGKSFTKEEAREYADYTE